MNKTRKTGIRLAIAFTITMVLFDILQERDEILISAIKNFIIIIIASEIISYIEKKIRKAKKDSR